MKSSLKRSLAVVCAATLCTALFAGCSNNTKTSSTTSSDSKTFANKDLSIAVFQGAYGRDYWDAVANAFMKKYPGTNIKITANPKLGDMIKPQIAAGNPPDFVYLNQGDTSGVTQSLINNHEIMDISDVFNGQALDKDSTIKDEILPGVLDSSFCTPYGDGKIYLAPYNYAVEGLWYNKTYFDKKGYEPPKTWDEFFDLNEKAKADGRALFTYQGIYPSYLEELLIPNLYSAGGDETVKEFDNYTLDWKGDAATKALDVFGKIASDGLLMEGTVALNHTQAQTAFMQGKAMFIDNGSWFETEMKDAPREDGFEFGFAGVPAFKEGDTVNALASIEQMYIPSKAKNPELAKEFLKFVYTDESVKLNGEKAKAVLCVKGATEDVKSYITESSYNCYSAVENGMHLIVSALSPVAVGSTVNVSDEIYKPISDLMNGQLTVSTWQDNLNKTYKQVKQELDDQQ